MFNGKNVLGGQALIAQQPVADVLLLNTNGDGQPMLAADDSNGPLDCGAGYRMVIIRRRISIHNADRIQRQLSVVNSCRD